MKNIGAFYYCSQCKKIITNLDEVIFVEQIHYYVFCCEKCIVEFYTPLINFFDQQLVEWRKEHNLLSENIQIEPSFHHQLVEKCLKNPDEIWIIGGENLNEEINVFIGKKEEHHPPITMILVLLLFEGHPSFILMETLTEGDELLGHFRQGRKVDNIIQYLNRDKNLSNVKIPTQEDSSIVNLSVDSETLNLVDDKRSQLMSQYLSERLEDDIPLDEFKIYENYLADTLQSPDEVFLDLGGVQEEGLFTYMKGFQRENVVFYYIVICINYQVDPDDGEQTLIPILSFPTKSAELYRKYKRGKQIEGHALI